MAKKRKYSILTKVSVGFLMTSAATRFFLGKFQNMWLKRHISADVDDNVFITHTKNSPEAVHVSYMGKNGQVTTENCTQLFLRLTWIDIAMKIMAVCSFAAATANIIFTILEAISDD